MSFSYPYEDEKSIHQRQGNAPEPPQAPFQRPSEVFFNRFTQAAPPAPVFDVAKEERLKKLSRVNALSRGLNLFGDLFSLYKGANVNRREPDQVSPSIYSSYEAMLDKYKADRDAHKFQLFQKQLQDAQLGIQLAKDDEMMNLRNSQLEAERENNRMRNELDWNKYANDYNLKVKGLEQTHDRNQETARHNRNMENIGYERIKASLAKEDENGNFMLYNNDRTPAVQLDKGEIEKVVQMILKDPATAQMAQKDLNLLKAQLGDGLSPQNIKTIVAHYWNQSDLVMQYLTGGKQSQQQEAPLPPEFDLSKQGLNMPLDPQQPKQSTKYSTGGWY